MLGQWLIAGTAGEATGGRIIETEAYLGFDDPASHAFAGRRYHGNRSIYGPPGSWYVYRSYGMHWCLNLVCGPPGSGAAVLIRAVRPEVGAEVIRSRRGIRVGARLTDGPGKLAQALGVDDRLDGRPMRESTVVVRQGVPVPERDVLIGPRVGITKAADWPLRYRVTSRWSLEPESRDRE